jgi:hypothetical protein
VAIEMDCFIYGISDKFIGIPSNKDVKDTNPRIPNAICKQLSSEKLFDDWGSVWGWQTTI